MKPEVDTPTQPLPEKAKPAAAKPTTKRNKARVWIFNLLSWLCCCVQTLTILAMVVDLGDEFASVSLVCFPACCCLLFMKKQILPCAQILDSDDDEEKPTSSESPLPSRQLQAKRPAQIIEDDSDDDFAAPVKRTAESGDALIAEVAVYRACSPFCLPLLCWPLHHETFGPLAFCWRCAVVHLVTIH